MPNNGEGIAVIGGEALTATGTAVIMATGAIVADYDRPYGGYYGYGYTAPYYTAAATTATDTRRFTPGRSTTAAITPHPAGDLGRPPLVTVVSQTGRQNPRRVRAAGI